jgi:hypothetical protein
MSLRYALGLLALAASSILPGGAVAAEEPLPDLAGHFQQICGTTDEAGPALPGNDVPAADAPAFFAGDLRRSTQSRVVEIGDRYAMRALMPSSADPRFALLLKCAVASGSTPFAGQVERLTAMLSAKPDLGKTAQGFDYAQYVSGTTGYYLYAEPDGWASIFKLNIVMQNVPKKYLKKGSRPAPSPSVR